MESSELRIGQLAALTGVSLDALRYYERRRLLPRARRTQGGFRVFTSETVERVAFIKHAQELGFSLEEIGELLSPGNATQCRRVRDLPSAKLAEVDKRLKSMRHFRRMLAAHLFSETGGAIFTTSDLRVRVGLKEMTDPIPLCYCFGFDESYAREEICRTGTSTIPQRIVALIKQKMCACPARNPSAACCLGEVTNAIRRLVTQEVKLG